MAYAHKIDGSASPRLKDFDPNETHGLKKEDGVQRTDALGLELSELEDLLFYAGHHSLLIVLQGMDTSGKDGTIRCILNHTSAQSVRIEPFKVPNEEERAHDFLWRIHQQTPRCGATTIFNRSHYEDVLVVRVHNLVPKPVWERRYRHINHFEELLADNDTLIVKIFLHISKEEQKERLLAREQETEKAWKLAVGDWKERELWDDYTAAYEDVLDRCSKPHAPWHVVPANHKWFRNLAVLELLVHALRPWRDEWMSDLEKRGKVALEEIRAFREAQEQKPA